MKNSKNKIAKKIGAFFAHVQIGLDDLSAFIFKKLKESGKEDKKTSKESTGKFYKFARKGIGFIGEIGSSFYEKYEDLKAKSKTKKSEK